MDIFAIDESKRDEVYMWVETKKVNGINELMNLFMDEKM